MHEVLRQGLTLKHVLYRVAMALFFLNGSAGTGNFAFKTGDIGFQLADGEGG